MTRYEQLLDNYEDAFFALLMEKAVMAEGKRILEENERLKKDPDFIVPPELNRACIKTINRAFRKKKIRTVRRVSYRVLQYAAVFILAAMLLFITAFAASETVRTVTLNFISATFYDHMEISFGETAPPASQSDPLNFEVGWLPEGFELLNQEKTQTFSWKDFTHPNGGWIDISFEIMTEGSVTAIDTENAEIEKIIINGWQAQVITKDYIQIVVFIEEYGCVMSVVGVDVLAEELVKIAENIIY